MRRASGRSHSVPLFLTDLAKKLSAQSGIQTVKYNPRGSLWQFSNNFKIFWSHLVIVQAKSGNFVKLFTRLVCQFAIAFKLMFEHDLPCRSSKLWYLYDFSLLFWHPYLWWSTISVFPSRFYYWRVPPGSSKSTSFCNLAHIFGMSWVLPAIKMSPTCSDKKNGIILDFSIQLDRQLGPNVVVFLLSGLWSKMLDNLFRKMKKFWCIFHFDLRYSWVIWKSRAKLLPPPCVTLKHLAP